MKFTAPAWILAHPEALENLKRGKLAAIGGKTYEVCKDCRQMIRIDKPLVGSLHFCATETGAAT